ncbi:glycerol-3-phosphate dehydrogenase [Thioclava sediminum]|uniref:Glycerol-3-phosphate dehydrogenase [NAD(P)+] n=1 Tax=Thioclava sediminum TaxID=1915319 RepID=A0ABX3MUI0_9RHOB|nr:MULTISPECIES: NAD(P)H-dependent glycerol-3-phosphate dehydrogenase [Thioclava]OOY14808.1 glycerol-3-phosphate dehydrogenase [Thioclava sp. DLFJ4-1]OOY22944.1 glycerol-3-phosphate dehydrogenase [Thioclava sediminum]
MSISVLGAGAFGTAMAVTLSQNGPVTLWARDAEQVQAMRESRENSRRLPGVKLPENVTVSAEIADALQAETLLLAMPMQKMAGFLDTHSDTLTGKTLVSCSKGIDLSTGQGPTALIRAKVPGVRAAVLTGPSFAGDIARGLPTALTLACADHSEELQAELSTPTLRLYRTTDTTGAELGGALKNVYAIAAGTVIGAGLGDSARAALMTRGFAEMLRIATELGARPETLSGLSGFGDLVLTCTSTQSRNFRFGCAIGSGEVFDPSITVEGAATAKALNKLAHARELEIPVAAMVLALTEQSISVDEAMQALLARPLKEE